MFNSKGNNHRGKNAPVHVGMTVELASGHEDRNKRKYDRNSLLEILNSISFDKISIPLYTYKNLLFGEDKKGTINVGYIKSFNPETEMFDVVVYNKNAAAVGSFEDVVIYPRMAIGEEGEVKIILSLDIVPADYFA